MKQHSKLIGGILLVAGTATGAGMLALPVSTGMAGFFPSLVLFVFYWLYMTYTAFLMLEVNLKIGEGYNLITMAKATLGRPGQIISWIIYLFLLYSLTTAYVAGGGSIVIDVINGVLGTTYESWLGSLPLLLIFGYFVYQGTHSVDYVNRFLMFGLLIAYIALAIFLTPYVDSDLLWHMEPQYLLMGVSVVATSFGFHIIIPSLVTYLNRDVRKLKRVLFIGSAIPLIVYSIWECLTLGIIPIDGANGIVEGYQEGNNGANLLAALLGHSLLSLVATVFSFFAIITSFLGVSLSLSHFLADGLKIKEETRSGESLLLILTFLPPLVITFVDPRAFLSGLEYAGAFGVVTLLGLLPALMVWSERYHKKLLHTSTFEVYGGKPLLLLVMLISVAVMGLEIAIKMDLLPLLLLE